MVAEYKRAELTKTDVPGDQVDALLDQLNEPARGPLGPTSSAGHGRAACIDSSVTTGVEKGS
jgi:hypothetical protein